MPRVPPLLALELGSSLRVYLRLCRPDALAATAGHTAIRSGGTTVGREGTIAVAFCGQSRELAQDSEASVRICFFLPGRRACC